MIHNRRSKGLVIRAERQAKLLTKMSWDVASESILDEVERLLVQVLKTLDTKASLKLTACDGRNLAQISIGSVAGFQLVLSLDVWIRRGVL